MPPGGHIIGPCALPGNKAGHGTSYSLPGPERLPVGFPGKQCLVTNMAMAAPVNNTFVQADKSSTDPEEDSIAPAFPLDPGMAPFGNFPYYYRFHPPAARLHLLPPTLLRSLFPAPSTGLQAPPLLALDVGCNSGDLSIALYRHLGLQENDAVSVGSLHTPGNLRFLCCDIDSALIERAEKSNPFPGSVSYAVLDVMDPAARLAVLRPFLDGFSRSTFDIGFCMSVTMWIHLNHGDEGLVEFLGWLASLCGYLLVEPQPWKCYRAAARRLRKLGRNDFDHFRHLAISGDMAERITGILTSGEAMELVRCFGNTSWDRSLLLFKSKRLKMVAQSEEHLVSERQGCDGRCS
ncbi:RNA 5'-monophosphate methyltransferase [Rhinatrema bivittatum]|uniref:RNA 5'-monophosphate methyltransferase n=1 Tax=Rhinatrema bivittatum TaxID=194408 RepID=UPI00112BA712|nr:RNA 5'-monophosphate methyltransferase [Rhinatrema bivittatum]XP_029450890.1 RNA 5'-monophosphate methyltransferase [Rhinatrema bivittatum]